MGKVGLVLMFGFVLAGCQGFPGLENASAASKAGTEALAAPSTASSAKPSAKAAAQPAPQPIAEAPSPTPLPVLHTDAAAVAGGIVVPPLADNDSRAQGIAAEKAQVDQLISQGGLTREAGAKRLYRFASKNGLLKGKADEDFWQSLIQAYRNLDDRYISAEDAAADINAAAARRAEVLK
jgi:hypothetical protein